MALLICGTILTAYAITLTVAYVIQQEDMKELDAELAASRFQRNEQRRHIGGLMDTVSRLECQLKLSKQNAKDDFKDYKQREEKLCFELNESRRESERLLDINNKLMERIKKIT